MGGLRLIPTVCLWFNEALVGFEYSVVRGENDTFARFEPGIFCCRVAVRTPRRVELHIFPARGCLEDRVWWINIVADVTGVHSSREYDIALSQLEFSF